MKYRFFISIVAFMALAVTLSYEGIFAQAKRGNAIKINPLSLLFRTTNISYERRVNSNQSFQTGIMISGIRLGDYQYSGLGFSPAYRFYVSGNSHAFNGIYISPFFSYQKFKIKDINTANYGSFSSLGGGTLFGWEKSFDSGFVLDFFIGPFYKAASFTKKEQHETFTLHNIYSGHGLKAGVYAGFTF